MLSWKQVRNVVGYVLTVVMLVVTFIAVESQSYDSEPSAVGRLKQYTYSARIMLYPEDDGLYPADIYPGDGLPIYPGDEKWDGQYLGDLEYTHEHYEVVDNHPYTLEVQALATDGQDLYASGELQQYDFYPTDYHCTDIMRWRKNRLSAQPVWQFYITGGCGIVGTVDALTVQSSRIYAGGTMTKVGATPVKNVAYWDGTQWNAMSSGLESPEGSASVSSLAAGSGSVYAGGSFALAGGAPANNVARWDGEKWYALSGGVNGKVNALTISGEDVYVGGEFSAAGGMPANNIARWDGAQWHSLGSGTDKPVYALAVRDGSIYAGGDFITAGGQTVNGIAQWDGDQWHAMGNGLGVGPGSRVKTIAAAPEGIYAGGSFNPEIGLFSANGIAFWDGAQWSILGSALYKENESMNGYLDDILVLGSRVFVGGRFYGVGGNESRHGFAIWHNQPEVEVFRIGETPVAPGSTLYLYGEYFPANSNVQLAINGKAIPKTLIADTDGKIYIRLITGPVNTEGEYTFTLSSGNYSTSGRFILKKGAPNASTLLDGVIIPYPGYPVHLPLISR